MNTLRFTALFAVLHVALSIPAQCSFDGSAGGYQVCTERDFQGTCEWYAPSDTCWSFVKAAKSIRPDLGGYCRIYDDAECTIQSSDVLLDGKTKRL
jgi:hypothetical protein